MRTHHVVVLGIVLLASGAGLEGQGRGQQNFNGPFPPHKIIGNVYYVGTRTLGSFLITTPAGHILINSTYERNVRTIATSVEQLGFKFSDVRILLGTHAHGDHQEGDALVKELTGAQVTWRNNGLMVHTIVAQDGSWTTGPLNPADVGGVTFDKPGSHAYMCKEHPWAVGQIVVTE